MKKLIILSAIVALSACQSAATYTDKDTGQSINAANQIITTDDGRLKFTGLKTRGKKIIDLENIYSVAPMYSVLEGNPKLYPKYLSENTDNTKESTVCAILHNANVKPVMINLTRQNCRQAINELVKALSLRNDVKVFDDHFVSGNLSCVHPKELLKVNPNLKGNPHGLACSDLSESN